MLDLGRPPAGRTSEGPTLLDRLLNTEINFENFERELLLLVLRRNKGNQSQTARMLGMSRRTVQYRITKFGIDPNEMQEGPQSSPA